MNVARVVEGPARADPDRTALIVGGRRVSYAELDDAARRAAGALAARGVRPGDRVPVLDAAGLPAVAAVLGAERLGAAAAPILPSLTADEVRPLLEAARCVRIGVAGDETAATLEAALGASPLRPSELLAARPLDGPPPDDDAAEALVLFTGGTTGRPKPVPMTHGMVWSRIRAFAPPFDPSVPAAVALVSVPFAHVGGVLGVLVGLASGTTLVVQRRFDAGEWLRLVERHRCSRAFLVPTLIRRILDHPGFAAADLSSLVLVTSGAAPLPPELARRFADALPGCALVNVFGQTETLGAVTAAGPDELRDPRRAGTVGRAMPGVEIRVVDPATGADLPDDTIGEVWVRAPFLGPGWHRTGDLARRDPEGYLYPAGRLAEVINRGGEKVAPAEVEEVLRAHPAVADAAVVGVPDEEMGERVGALVVPREPVEADELRAWCRTRLARHKVPERIALVEALPVNEVGKVPRRAALGLLLERTGRAGPPAARQ
jgi:acyl-CoA synthetase (AMP-forming)/AMP-acid ligase II